MARRHASDDFEVETEAKLLEPTLRSLLSRVLCRRRRGAVIVVLTGEAALRGPSNCDGESRQRLSPRRLIAVV